jgi:hypothetical protein
VAFTTDFHFGQLTCNNKTHTSATLLPHCDVFLARWAAATTAILAFCGAARLVLTPLKERRELVEVTHVISRPILEACAEDLEFKGEQCIKHVLPSWRWEGVEHGEEVGTFCCGLLKISFK